jgi:formiminoglutamase
MKLPFFISVPHAGTLVTPEVQDFCLLNREEILADRDGGACSIYHGLEEHCAGFITSGIARVVVDLNRAPDHIGGDGVIKDHTSWQVPVYKKFPDEKLIQSLLSRYYFPYHEKLTAAASDKEVLLGIDCHTMSAVGPPVGPDPGKKRPLVCVSNADGTCPQEWIMNLADCFSDVFKQKTAINKPFRGGFITRSHAVEMPWIQIEISRTDACSNDFKRDNVLEGLHRFCQTLT